MGNHRSVSEAKRNIQSNFNKSACLKMCSSINRVYTRGDGWSTTLVIRIFFGVLNCKTCLDIEQRMHVFQ